MPVSASEPYSRTATWLVAWSRPSPFKPSANSRAARMGPMVWELDGPMPTLKMSKTLSDMAIPFSIPAAKPSEQLATVLIRPLGGPGSQSRGNLHASGKFLAALLARRRFVITSRRFARRAPAHRNGGHNALEHNRTSCEDYGIA